MKVNIIILTQNLYEIKKWKHKDSAFIFAILSKENIWVI